MSVDTPEPLVISAESEILGTLDERVGTVTYREGYDKNDVHSLLEDLTKKISEFRRRKNWEKFFEVPDEFRARFTEFVPVNFVKSYDLASAQEHVESSISFFEGLIADERRAVEIRRAEEEVVRIEEELARQEELARAVAEAAEEAAREAEARAIAEAAAHESAFSREEGDEITEFTNGESHTLDIDNDSDVTDNIMDQIMNQDEYSYAPEENYEELDVPVREEEGEVSLDESEVEESFEDDVVDVVDVVYDVDVVDVIVVDDEEVATDEEVADVVEDTPVESVEVTVTDDAAGEEDDEEVQAVSLVEFIAMLQHLADNRAQGRFAPVVIRAGSGDLFPITGAKTNNDGTVELLIW